MGWFSTTYNPEYFKNKTVEEILKVKPSDIDKDFFTKYATDPLLPEINGEKKKAIELLINLKNNDVPAIFNAYKSGAPAAAPAAAAIARPASQPARRPPSMPLPGKRPASDPSRAGPRPASPRPAGAPLPGAPPKALGAPPPAALRPSSDTSDNDMDGGGRRKRSKKSKRSSKRSNKRSKRTAKK